jgi:hypothetical protein
MIMAHIRTEKQDENLGGSSRGNLFHFPGSINGILSGIKVTPGSRWFRLFFERVAEVRDTRDELKILLKY